MARCTSTRPRPRQGATAVSNAAGRYTLRRLEPGTYSLYAESKRVGAFTHSPPVTIAAGEQRTGFDVDLNLAASIAGTVVDQNDAPVRGVFVHFSLLHGRDFGSATTAEDGTFRASALSGGGDYVYEVRQTEVSPTVLPPAVGRRFPPIAVRDGVSQVTGVRIKIKYQRLAISGRVLDASGNAIADATVLAKPPEMADPTRATTDEAGAFAIRDLSPGTYDLVATSPHARARVSGVAAGRSDVIVQVAVGGVIVGTLEGFSGAPEVTASSAEERMRPLRAVVRATSFRIDDVPAGHYEVSAQSDGIDDVASVDVSPGQTATVVLKRHDVGTIAGTFVSETGHVPVADAFCFAIDERTRRSYHCVQSNKAGEFRIENVPQGEERVDCFTDSERSDSVRVVVGNGVTHVDLVTRAPPKPQTVASGLTLEQQLSMLLVAGVDPGSPAERAGLAVGDVITEVDGYAVTGQAEFLMSEIDHWLAQRSIKLTVERGDKSLSITLAQ